MVFLISLGFAFFIIAVVLLILAPIQAAQNKRRTEETAGYVTEVRKTYQRRKGTTYHINFQYTANGAEQLLKNVKWQVEPNEPRYTICYNPKKTWDAHVKEFRYAGAPKAYAIAGAVLFVLSIVLIVIGSVMG